MLRTKAVIIYATLVLLVFFIGGCSDSDSPTESETPAVSTWVKTYGGTGWEYGNAVVNSPDGGFVIAGGTSSFGAGASDVYLLKVDAEGNVVWERSFGGAGSDVANDLCVGHDGGYIIVGTTHSFGAGNSDILLIGTDFSGSKLWQKTFGGDKYENGHAVIPTADGGYAVVGWTSSFDAQPNSVYFIKTDANGEAQAEKIYGVGGEVGHDLMQTADSGFVIVGSTESFGVADDNNNAYVIKTDKFYNIEWDKPFGGLGNDFGYAAVLDNNRIIVAGWTGSYGAVGYDAYLFSVDLAGDLLWETQYGGSGYDGANALTITTGGEYVVVGHRGDEGDSSGGGYAAKFNSGGSLIWERVYGGVCEKIEDIIETPDRGFLLLCPLDTGDYSDIRLIKTDSSGNISDEEP